MSRRFVRVLWEVAGRKSIARAVLHRIKFAQVMLIGVCLLMSRSPILAGIICYEFQYYAVNAFEI
jgi:hypothetical protein